MDDAIGLIIALVLLALLVGGIILPIVALVVSIRTRNKLNQQLSRFQGSSALPPAEGQGFSQILQELTARVSRLEAVLAPKSPSPSPPAEAAKPEEGRPQPPQQLPVAPPARAFAPPPQAIPSRPSSTTTAPRTINAQELESII